MPLSSTSSCRRTRLIHVSVPQTGLQSHAIKHYEAVLDMISRDDQMPVEDETRLESNLSKAAAYNLVTLYSMSGVPELARAVAETWLSA